MAWLNIEGHDQLVERFRHALAQGRLASTFLFVGPEGIGKRSFALGLAQALLCQTRDERQLDPCGHCPGCAQVLAGTHPDLITLARPAGKSEIPVGLLKGDDTYPVEQSLVFNLAMRPFYGGRKVAILDDADFLNLAGANGLLKTLEEPPPGSVLILISTSADRQLPTIRSRSQIIRFQPLSETIVAGLLLKNRAVNDPAEAQRLAAFSGGSLARAAELAGDPGMWAFRSVLLERLSQHPLRSVVLAQTIIKFVDEAGKEASARRARLRSAIGFTVDFFRQLVRQLARLACDGDAELRSAVERAARQGGWDVESAGEAAERSLEALVHVDRNANLHTAIEAWLDDLLALNSRTTVTTAK